jgi:hypothetical protein
LAEDTSKKGPGGRDIGDLRARLGLNKGAGAPQPAAAPTPAGVPRVPAPAQSGVPSPAGRSVPAPPGFPSAAPAAGPPPPDPRRDPFAAAAPPAMPAYYGYQPLPGTDDGAPATQISQPKPWGLIGGIAGGAFVLLMAGVAVGRIYAARVNMNMTIDQAADIRAEVDKLAKTLSTINDLINSSANVAKGQPDVALAAKMGELELKKPEQDKIFHTNYFFLKDLAIDRLFNYYNDTIILYDLLQKQAKKTEADKEAIENFLKEGAGKGEKNYGVTLDMSGAIPLAHVVEVGTPVCPKEGQTDCSANELKGFKYRTDSGGQWFVKPVKGPPAQTLFPIQKTPFFASIASGSPDILAVKDHLRRMAEIRVLTTKLFNEQKELLADLDTATTQKKVNPAILF